MRAPTVDPGHANSICLDTGTPPLASDGAVWVRALALFAWRVPLPHRHKAFERRFGGIKAVIDFGGA